MTPPRCPRCEGCECKRMDPAWPESKLDATDEEVIATHQCCNGKCNCKFKYHPPEGESNG